MATVPPKQTAAEKAAGGPTTDAAVNKQIKDPTGGVKMADAGALNAVYAEDGSVVPTAARSREQEATDEARRRVLDPEREPFISEGMRHDLEEGGMVADPLTGRRLTMDKDGNVKAEARE